MSEPIRITIAYDATGRPVIRQAVSDLSSLSVAASRNAAVLAGGGRALRQFEHDVNRLSMAFSNRFGAAVNQVSNSLSGFIRLTESLGRRGFYAMTAGAIAATYTFQRLGKEFLNVNEQFSNLEITLKSSYRNALIARDLRNELAKITADSPIPFRDLADATRTFSVLPQTRSKIALQSAQGTLGDREGFYRQSLKLVEQMVAFRPDKTEEDAIFAIREALSGQFRSLVRRFDIPLRYVASQVGKTGEQLQTDPELTFKALQKTFGGIITPQAVREYARQPKVLFENLKEQIFDLPSLAVGDEGFYKSFLTKIGRFYDSLVMFVTKEIQPYAQRVSEVLSGLVDTLGGTTKGLAERLLSMVSLGKADRPDMSLFDRIAEAVTRAFEAVNRNLPNVFDRVNSFFKSITPLIEGFATVFGKVFEVFTKYPIATLLAYSQLGNLGSALTGGIRGGINRVGAAAASSVAYTQGGVAAAQTFMQGFRQAIARNSPAMQQSFGGVNTLGSFIGRRNVDVGSLVNTTRTGMYQASRGIGTFTPQQLAYFGIPAARAAATPGARPFLDRALSRNALAVGTVVDTQTRGALRAGAGARIGGALVSGAGMIAQTVAPIALIAVATYGVVKAFEALQESATKTGAALARLTFKTEDELTRSLREQSGLNATSQVKALEEALKKQNFVTGRNVELPKVAFPQVTMDKPRFEETSRGYGNTPRLETIYDKTISSNLITPTEASVQLAQSIEELDTLKEIIAASKDENATLERIIAGNKVTTKDIRSNVKKWESQEAVFALQVKMRQDALKTYVDDLLGSTFFEPGYKPAFTTVYTDMQQVIRADAQDKIEAALDFPNFIQKELVSTYGKLTSLVEALPDPEALPFEDDLQAFRTQLVESSNPFSSLADNMRAVAGSLKSLNDSEQSLKNRLLEFASATVTIAGVTQTVQASEVSKAQGVFTGIIEQIERASSKAGVKSFTINGREMSKEEAVAQLTMLRDNFANKLSGYFSEPLARIADTREGFIIKATEEIARQVTAALPAINEASSPARADTIINGFKQAWAPVLRSMDSTLALNFAERQEGIAALMREAVLDTNLEGSALDREKIRVKEVNQKLYNYFSETLFQIYQKSVASFDPQKLPSVMGTATKGSFENSLKFYFPNVLETTPSPMGTEALQGAARFRGLATQKGNDADTAKDIYTANERKILKSQRETNVTRLFGNMSEFGPTEYGRRAFTSLVEDLEKLGNPALASRLMDLKTTFLADSRGPENIANYVKQLEAWIPLLEEAASVKFAEANNPALGLEQQQALREQGMRLLRQSGDAGQDLKDITGDNDPWASFKDGMLSVTESYRVMAQNFRDIGAGIAESISSSFGEAFDSLITNSKSAGEAFADMGRSMLRTAANMFAQKAFQAVLGYAVGAMFGGGATTALIAGASARGAANPALFGPGYAEGGHVRGGSGNRDDVPILAMGGEYMLSKQAARSLQARYGGDILDTLNRGILPSLYAVGGPIPLSSPSPLAKTSPSPVSARLNAMSSDSYTFNITINEGKATGMPDSKQSGGLDPDTISRVVRAAVVTEIQRQKRQGGEFS